MAVTHEHRASWGNFRRLACVRTRAMNKVLISGITGSGKTTLAVTVYVLLGLPWFELDALHHGPGWVKRQDFETDADNLLRRVPLGDRRPVPHCPGRSALAACRSFTPPEPKSTSMQVLDAKLQAGRHSIALPAEVPSVASFLAVTIGSVVRTFTAVMTDKSHTIDPASPVEQRAHAMPGQRAESPGARAAAHSGPCPGSEASAGAPTCTSPRRSLKPPRRMRTWHAPTPRSRSSTSTSVRTHITATCRSTRSHCLHARTLRAVNLEGKAGRRRLRPP
jgi:hypothetical protein